MKGGHKGPEANIDIITIFITCLLISLLMLVEWINKCHPPRVTISKFSYDFFWGYIDIRWQNNIDKLSSHS